MDCDRCDSSRTVTPYPFNKPQRRAQRTMSRPPPPASIASLREEEEEDSSGEEEDQLDDRAGSDSGSEEDPLAELFYLDGKPCRFFLHDSLTPGMKDEVTNKIEAFGGKTTTHERRAQVILVCESRLSRSLDLMQKGYDRHEDQVLRNIYVKPLTFIKQCANSGLFRLGKEKWIKAGMPGPKPGDRYRS